MDRLHAFCPTIQPNHTIQFYVNTWPFEMNSNDTKQRGICVSLPIVAALSNNKVSLIDDCYSEHYV